MIELLSEKLYLHFHSIFNSHNSFYREIRISDEYFGQDPGSALHRSRIATAQLLQHELVDIVIGALFLENTVPLSR